MPGTVLLLQRRAGVCRAGGRCRLGFATAVTAALICEIGNGRGQPVLRECGSLVHASDTQVLIVDRLGCGRRSGEDAGGREARGRAPGSAGLVEQAGLRADSPEAEAAGTGPHLAGWALQAQRRGRRSLR